MKYLKQFTIILLITFMGEMLKCIIPMPVPASIYGMILLYIALSAKIIRLSAVEEAGKFLIEIMPLMFIPSGAGLLEIWDILKPVSITFAIITIVSTIAVMAVSGRVTQVLMKNKNKGEK
ncbi:MAG: CidA/LrgA family protein [bacterium]|nr:CidA/LrgA family protein [bacterium]